MFGNEFGNTKFPVAQFRILMNVVPPGNYFLLYVVGLLSNYFAVIAPLSKKLKSKYVKQCDA